MGKPQRRKKSTTVARRRRTRLAHRGRLGRIENIVEIITTKCANCAVNFEQENERNVKLGVMKDPYTHEIEIVDAFYFIYGVTVADWSKTVTEEVGSSDFKNASDNISSKGISLCHQCTSALENVYKSHQTLKMFSNSESLFTKTLHGKWGWESCEIPIKTETTDDFESPPSDYEKICLEEMEIKQENNSENESSFFDADEMTRNDSFESDGPLVEHTLNDRQSSSFSPFLPDTSENDPDNETNCLNVPTLDVPRKIATQTNGRSRKKGNSTELCLKEPTKNPKKSRGRTDRMSPHTSHRASLDHPFKVACCDKSFYTEIALMDHIAKYHNEIKEGSFTGVKCRICEILIPLNSIQNHMKTFKRTHELYFKCKFCYAQFQNSSSIIKHWKTHDPECGTWLCDICEAPFGYECDLIVHKIIKHSENPEARKIFPCNKCGEEFVNSEIFKLHFEKHSTFHKTCKDCDMVFTSSITLSKHIRVRHSQLVSAKYMCKICNLKFRSATFLQKHKARNICNLPKRRFVCEKCGKTFLSSGHLKTHMDQHEDMENPNKESFKCPICEKMLKHRSSLKKHLAREHPKEPKKLFFCEKCGKSTKNMTNLRIHMKVHQNKNESDCSVIGVSDNNA